MRSAVRPRPHQVQALTGLQVALTVHDRVQLVMACGTGKTLVGRWHAEAAESSCTLVLVPSLALVAQTLQEWRRIHGWPFDALVVCSDPTTSAGTAERVDEDGLPLPGPDDLGSVRARTTTDPGVARQFLHSRRDRPAVVFSTYHSAPVVAAAQSASGTVFDLVICDEAHRLTGAPRPEFVAALDPRQIVARKRLFMTATPRFTESGYSMDDPATFGPVAHTVSFGDAIGAGLLCDYRVVVLGTPGAAVIDDRDSCTPAAVLEAIDTYGLRRILSFHSRIARAEAFTAALDGSRTSAGVTVASQHLAGHMPTAQREEALSWLRNADGDQARLLGSARVLSEGVDVPAVDTALFADPRSSVTDIIQAIGRVLRPHPDKKVGTIIVPIALPANHDDDTELLVSRFSLLWSVLRALRAHDERFARDLDRAVHSTPGGPGGYLVGPVEFVLPAWCDTQMLRARIVTDLSDGWERFYTVAEAWAEQHPDRRMPRNARHHDIAVGEWAFKQRQARRRGMLSADRVARLDRIAGWYWDRADTAWHDTFTILQDYAREHGTVADHQRGDSRFTGLRAALPQREKLGAWMATQRHAYRSGALEAARVAALETLPGWSWAPLPAEDLAMVDALRQFVEFEKHAAVPARHVEDGLELGRWVWDVRRRKLTGTLHPSLADELWLVGESPWRGGSPTRFAWEKTETQWRLAYTALRTFAAREGHCSPAASHTEELHDGPVRVGQWVALQRHLQGKGELDERRAAALQRLAGWSWTASGGRAAEEPIELPDHLHHGAGGAVARGCRCAECRGYQRAIGRRSLANRRDAMAATRTVSAEQALRHLRQVEEELASTIDNGQDRNNRSLLAHVAGVPLACVRDVLNGTRAMLTEEEHRNLLSVSTDACRAQLGDGSRGRAIQTHSHRIPSGPTLALLDDLAQRGFTAGWVGRELGYHRAHQVHSAMITQGLADRIRELHTTVGDLVAPTLGRRRIAPPLAELRHDHAA